MWLLFSIVLGFVLYIAFWVFVVVLLGMLIAYLYKKIKGERNG